MSRIFERLAPGSRESARPSGNAARLRAILEAALDCVITIDHRGRILEFNPAAEQVFGYSRSDVLGQQIAELLIPERLRHAHYRGLERYLATGEGTVLGRRIEMPALRSDCTEFSIELAITRVGLPGPPVFTAYVRDITDRKRSEDELRQSRELYRNVVENTKDLVGLIDLEGRLLYASPSHEEKLGHSPDELVGGELSSLIHADDLPQARAALALAEQGERGSFSGVRLRHRTGRWLSLEGEATGVVGDHGSIETILLTARDLTAEAERVRHERAERAFVTNAAHDLRTPLAAMRAAIDVLQSGAKEIPEERDRFLEDLEHETERLSRLVQALLVLAAVQTGQAALRLEPIDLQPLLEDVAGSIRPSDDVEVVVDCPSDLAVLAERDILERALTNLAVNAAAHTDRGHISFVATDTANGSVEIAVRDTGSGIARDEHERVFDRFYRVEDRNHHGFGLGLAIVHEAVAVLGGSVAIESAIDRGTIVRVLLPAPGPEVVP